jgi:glycosyltransferase involved in cell wall biosynthesis
MLKVAYISADPDVPVFGWRGSSVHIQEVIRAFRGIGAEVSLFTPPPEGYAPPDLIDLKVREIRLPEASGPAQKEEVLLAANRQLIHMLEDHGPFDLVYERYSLWGFGGMSYSRANSVPSVLEVNEPLIESGIADKTLIDIGGSRQIAKRAFTDAGTIVAVSREVRNYLKERTQEFGKVRVVQNGANIERFKPGLIPALPDRQSVFTVGYAGRLSMRQGIDTLVKAFAILHRRDPRARLLLVGDGPDRDAIAQAASSVGIAGSVELTGAVSPGIVPRLMASMDVAVVPHPKVEHFYGSPIKLFEYMASGLAVVASSLGQPAEIIEDGVNGMLTPPGDFVALSRILDSLRKDPQLRTQMGAAASEHVHAKNSWTGVVQKVMGYAGLARADGEKSFATASA